MRGGIKTAHIKEWDRLRTVPLFLFGHDCVTKEALSRHRGGANFFVFWRQKEGDFLWDAGRLTTRTHSTDPSVIALSERVLWRQK